MEPNAMHGTCDEDELHRDRIDSEVKTEDDSWIGWVTETKRANPQYQPSRYQGGHETEVLKAASSINKAALTEAVRPRVCVSVSRASHLPTHRCRNSDCAELDPRR
jgi:hypothetical protein